MCSGIRRLLSSLIHAGAARQLSLALGVVLMAPCWGWTQSGELATLAGKFGQLYREGRYAEAEKTSEEIISLLAKSGAAKDLDVAALNNLGSLAYAQLKYDTAETFYERALQLCEAVAGPGHVDVADVLYNLAGLSVMQGRYERAESLYQRSLKIRQAALGSEDPAAADVLNNLGFLYLRQNKLQLADQALRHALLIWQKHFGSETAPLAAVTLNNLAVVRFRQNGFEEAESLYKQALAIEEKFWGKDHPETTTTLRNLGEFCRAQGRRDEAVRIYQRALAMLEKALGPGDALTRETARRLGELSAKTEDSAPAGADRLGVYQIIMVRTKSEADHLLERIKKGENFDELALAHSLDPTAPERGYFKAKTGDLREELRSRLERLDEGEVSEVFDLNNNWAIVKKIKNSPQQE